MKLRSPLRRRRTRLEIIPLIDIMFFLLASFMMVSLQMQKVRTLKASLPTATLATAAAKPDMVTLTVNRNGQVAVDSKPISFPEPADAAYQPLQPGHQPARLYHGHARCHARLGDVCAGFCETRRHPARGHRGQARPGPFLKTAMRTFQQNLLITRGRQPVRPLRLSMARPDRAAGEIQKLEHTVYEKSAAIQGYTNSIRTMDAPDRPDGRADHGA